MAGPMSPFARATVCGFGSFRLRASAGDYGADATASSAEASSSRYLTIHLTNIVLLPRVHCHTVGWMHGSARLFPARCPAGRLVSA